MLSVAVIASTDWALAIPVTTAPGETVDVSGTLLTIALTPILGCYLIWDGAGWLWSIKRGDLGEATGANEPVTTGSMRLAITAARS